MKEMKWKLMRKPIFESDGEPPEDSIQRKSSIPNIQLSADLEANLRSSKGKGSPIPEDTRKDMEAGFGADFWRCADSYG